MQEGRQPFLLFGSPLGTYTCNELFEPKDASLLILCYIIWVRGEVLVLFCILDVGTCQVLCFFLRRTLHGQTVL